MKVRILRSDYHPIPAFRRYQRGDIAEVLEHVKRKTGGKYYNFKVRLPRKTVVKSRGEEKALSRIALFDKRDVEIISD